ncbi:MAG: hypothetical protein KDJ41_07500 [Hyphomicrobiaceae bacterium]|nr:hypothetical protein [Hyphomicrobiaceae bacterium]
MKIKGLEGLSETEVSRALANGATFVHYQYCISIVVMTFKRPSSIYFVRPGQSRVGKGLPFTVVSLLLGWWGIPWGPIYTVQTIINNTRGGRDVTSEVLAAASSRQP